MTNVSTAIFAGRRRRITSRGMSRVGILLFSSNRRPRKRKPNATKRWGVVRWRPLAMTAILLRHSRPSRLSHPGSESETDKMCSCSVTPALGVIGMALPSASGCITQTSSHPSSQTCSAGGGRSNLLGPEKPRSPFPGLSPEATTRQSRVSSCAHRPTNELSTANYGGSCVFRKRIMFN